MNLSITNISLPCGPKVFVILRSYYNSKAVRTRKMSYYYYYLFVASVTVSPSPQNKV